jgi:hypothetical protein
MTRSRRPDPRPVPPPLATPACRALAVPLVLGIGVLSLCLCLSGTEYLKAEPVVAEETEVKEEKQAKDEAQLIRVPVIPLEAGGRLTEEVNLSKVEAARQRVAANILIRSGYLAQFSVATDSQTGLPAMRATLNGVMTGCAWVDSPESDQEPMANSAIAVVAIEKFNRSSMQRRLEWWYSRLVLKLTGHLPDFSVGPAQIRPSTVRRMGKTPTASQGLRELAGVSDEQLLDHLMDECQAMGTAAALLQSWYGELHSLDAAIKAYGGQRRQTHAVIDYVPVVYSINAMIKG